MAKQILTNLDLLALPSLTTPKAGSVGFGAKSDGLYQKIGAVENRLATIVDTVANASKLNNQSPSYYLDYNNLSNRPTVLSQFANDLNFSTESFVNNAIDGLEIGGRNLLPYSELKEYIGGNIYNKSLCYSVSSERIIATNQPTGSSLPGWVLYLAGSTQITLSGSTDATRVQVYYRCYNSLGEAVTQQLSFTTSVIGGKFSTTRLLNFPIDTLYVNIGIGDTSISNYWIKPKLELGTKATDWTPAPEDQVSDWNTTDVNSFSFIKNKPTLLSQFTDNIGVATHIANKTNPHNVTKSQVGLGSADNTADSAKNVLSATKLTTARTIGGVSFNGTANINLPGVNTAGNQNTSGTAAKATILATTRAINGTNFNGSANITTANWGTARTLSFTGDVTGSSSVNGSKDVATAMTLANSGVTAGTYRSVTVDVKGRVTAGTNPTTLSGYGITDATSLSIFNSHVNNKANPHEVDVPQITGLNLDSLALGLGSEANEIGSVALGKSAQVYGKNSLGINGTVYGEFSTAINTWVEGFNSFGLGGQVYGDNSIAIGGMVEEADHSIAIGRYSYVGEPNTGVLGTKGANGSGTNKWVIPGNLAIGKDTTATEPLDVVGNIKASGTLTTPKVSFGNGWTAEGVGVELQFKLNGVIQAKIVNGALVSMGGITALST